MMPDSNGATRRGDTYAPFLGLIPPRFGYCAAKGRSLKLRDGKK